MILMVAVDVVMKAEPGGVGFVSRAVNDSVFSVLSSAMIGTGTICSVLFVNVSVLVTVS